MACVLVNEATGGAPLSTNDYNAQNINRQALLYKFMSDQLHLTQWETLNIPKIRLGTYIQHGGPLFVVEDANEDITDPGGLANGRIYIKATRTGDVLTFEFADSAAGYSWNYIYCGFYHADGTQLLPYVLYLTAGGDWYKYTLKDSENKYDIEANLILKTFSNIGDWDMDSNATLSTLWTAFPLYVPFNNILDVRGWIRDDSDTERELVHMQPNVGLTDIDLRISQISNASIILSRRNGGRYDDPAYNATSYNRGILIVDFYI